MSIINKIHSGARRWRCAIVAASCLLLHCVLASAQTTSNPNVLIVPFGLWQVCESAWGSQSIGCDGFTPGSEQFLLLVKAGQPGTTEYLYTIVATMQDGSTRAVSGQLKRHDNNAGFTSTSLYFGGVAVSFNTTIEEAVVSGTQTATGTFQR